MDLKENKTFCIKPFIQYSSFNDSYFRLCCTAKEPAERISTNNLSIKDFYSSDYLKNTRKSLLEGKKIHECSECYMLEKNNLESDRISANREFKEGFPELYDKIVSGNFTPESPLVLDLRVGNKCNLKCQSCFPDLSNGVNDDRVMLNKQNSKINFAINKNGKSLLNAGFDLNQLKDILPNIIELKLIGGEPLISPSALDLIKYIDDKKLSKNISLKFHTNLTTFNSMFIELLSNFKSVTITLSMDGVGKKNNYLRFPSKWDTCYSNLLSFADYSSKRDNFRLNISPVIQLSNITSTHELLYLFAKKLQLQEKHIRVFPIMLMDPNYLSAYIAPINIKEKAIELFSNEFNELDQHSKNYFKEFKDAMESILLEEPNEKLLKKYVDITLSYDKLRNHSIKNVFPEFEQIKNLFY